MQKSVIAIAACFLLNAAWAQKPAEPGSNAESEAKAANPPAVESHSYKGVLVNASCPANVTQTSKSGNTADRTDTAAQSTENKACTVTTGTKEFALRTADGRILRFDAVGNQRAEEALQNQKKWKTAVSDGKTISAKVTATRDGDNLTVLTLD